MRELFVPEYLQLESSEAVSRETVNRQLTQLADGFTRVFDLEPERDVGKVEEGQLRFFDAAVYDPGLGSGLYLYQGGRWNLLSMTPVT